MRSQVQTCSIIIKCIQLCSSTVKYAQIIKILRCLYVSKLLTTLLTTAAVSGLFGSTSHFPSRVSFSCARHHSIARCLSLSLTTSLLSPVEHSTRGGSLFSLIQSALFLEQLLCPSVWRWMLPFAQVFPIALFFCVKYE